MRKEKGGRPHQVKVLLTAAERDQLRERAAAVRLSVPRFLLESSLRETGTVPQRRAVIRDLVRARVAVALAGSNLNQIARVANSSGRVLPDEVVAAALEMVKLGDRLALEVERLGGELA